MYVIELNDCKIESVNFFRFGDFSEVSHLYFTISMKRARQALVSMYMYMNAYNSWAIISQ